MYLYISFIMLRYVLCILDSFEFLSWRNVEFCQQPFLHLVRWSYGFCFWIYLYDRLHLLIYICQTIPEFLRWSWLYYDGVSFWCVLEFSLEAFLKRIFGSVLISQSYHSCFDWIFGFRISLILDSQKEFEYISSFSALKNNLWTILVEGLAGFSYVAIWSCIFVFALSWEICNYSFYLTAFYRSV